MAARSLTDLTRDLGQALLRQDGAGLSDAQLLTRFVEQEDEAAFEALVRRHAPMILGVCRRLLRNAHDVEDAVQVVLLVLARKAASVWPRERLANWLYGVACKAALKARSAAARRRERPVAELPEPRPVIDRPVDDLRPVLDRELSRLPAKYRAVVVLCDLEGRTRRDAAQELGWPEGTVCGRLARARALLARRLTRGGVTCSAIALEILLAADASSACAPTSPLPAALRSVGLGGATPAATVPSRVLVLAQSVQRALFLGQLKIAAATALLASSLLGAGVGMAGLVHRQAADTDAKQTVAAEAQRAVRRTAPVRDSRTDAERLQGSWVLVRLVADGKTAPAEQIRGRRLVLNGKDFQCDCVREIFRQATYTIHATQRPAWLDFTSQGDFEPHVCRGIYRIEEGQLTFCYAAPNAERPDRFESKPGSDVTLSVWKRLQK